MASKVPILDAYRKRSKMAGLPTDETLIGELERRSMQLQQNKVEAALETMFEELDDAQDTIDNRADAIVKLAGFLGAGLAVLGKLDGRSAIKVLSLIVVCASGFALGLALLSSSHSAHRETLLLPPTKADLRRSCDELRRNQRFLAAATLFAFAAGVLAVAAVFVSIV